ncbi:MAG: D-alanyl-D-alanine carboxypeptidase, partial [Comamonadaceae bacterium]
MPEASLQRVSSPRIRIPLSFRNPSLHLIAALLCTAVLWVPAAQAAAKRQAVPAKKQAVESTRKVAASATRAPRASAAPAARAVAATSRVVKAGRNVTAQIRQQGGKTVVAVQRRSVMNVVEAAPRLSFGQMAGLHAAGDALDLKSSVALVIDQDTREVLFSKNDHAVLPIASLTKLMTGLLISEARLPTDELITITQDDVDT